MTDEGTNATEPDPKNSEEQLVARLDFATIAFPPGQTTDLWMRVRYKLLKRW